MPQTNPRPVAFFDLDETLLAVNSARLWARHLWQQKQVSHLQLARFFAYLLRYKLALIDAEKIAALAAEQLLDRVEDDLRAQVHAWYDLHVQQHLYAEGRALVEEHRRQGHALVLLTAASPYLAERVLQDLRLDFALSTRPEVLHGRLTGKLIQPLCYGEGKITWAERLAQEQHLDLDHSFFYTDSFTDLPMLRRVTFPVAVNPDPRLRRLALREGIPVRHFKA